MALLPGGIAADQAQKDIANRKPPNPFVQQIARPTGQFSSNIFNDAMAGNVSAADRNLNTQLVNYQQAQANAPVQQASNQSAIDSASKGLADQKYKTPEEAAAYIAQLAKSLGISGPADTRDATRTAAFQGLDKSAYMDAIRGANQLSAQGQERGSRSQALSALRGNELAGNKAQTEAQIQGQYASQLADYQRAMLGGAQAQAANQSNFGMQQAQDVLSNERNTANDEYQRQLQAYQAAMAQNEQANTADMMAIQRRAGNLQAGLGVLGSALGAGAQLGAAGIAK